jgi:hypothetical protein
MIAIMAAISQVWAGNVQKSRYWKDQIKSRGLNVSGDVFLSSFPFKDGPTRKRVSEALSAIGL